MSSVDGKGWIFSVRKRKKHERMENGGRGQTFVTEEMDK